MVVVQLSPSRPETHHVSLAAAAFEGIEVEFLAVVRLLLLSMENYLEVAALHAKRTLIW
jgi:hypothetical protein